MAAKTALYNLKETVLEQFFPVTCPFCGTVISFRQDCCDKCRPLLNALKGCCSRCGKQKCICERLNFIDRLFAPFPYDNLVQNAVARFKFQGHREYAKMLAAYMALCLRTSGKINADFIVYVPMERAKYRERGYNQAEELAKELGTQIGVPVLEHALLKKKKTPLQHLLTLEERKENLKGVFTLGGVDISGKRLLLCDDVCTTGMTMEFCAEVLKKHGAAVVTGISFASTQ